MSEFGFQKLDAWKHGMDLVTEIYKATESSPRSEQFGLSSQMRRAAVSIPSNIAEGYGRQTKPLFAHHCRIAQGSLFELRTELEIAVRTGIASQVQVETLLEHAIRLSRILDGFIRSLEG